MNGALRIRDPLTLDEKDTLEALSARWSAVYRIDYDGRRWLASRWDGTGETLRGLTSDDLAAGLRASR